MNLDQFFHRIHFQREKEIQFTDLGPIMFQFAKYIPFENSKLVHRVNDVITFEEIQRRLIDQSLGGVCYELNPLLYLVLKELGFNVKLLSATIFGNEKLGLIRTHIVILLIEDGKRYLIDVGSIAHAALQPVPFTNEFVNRSNEKFRVRYSPSKWGEYLLEKFEEDNLSTGYYFDLNPIDERYLHQVKEVIQSNPHTLLHQSILLSRISEEGRLTLTKNSYTVTSGGKKEKYQIDEETFQRLCRKQFGINPSDLIEY